MSQTERPEIQDLLARIAALPKQHVPAVLVALTARALQPDPPEPRLDIPAINPTPQVEGNRLLTAEEVALALGLDVASVMRRRFPFRVKLGRRTVRYSSEGLRLWTRRNGLTGG